ncbi:hypothetical protein JTB14_025587 [Gonioctena quinquepunctata]|nr:hypothetical protein JTB14_025587 [Gonioctena quinquepunctata]
MIIQEGKSENTCITRAFNDKLGGTHVCNDCGKCYTYGVYLHRHKELECGIERRFECPKCHRRFKLKHHLKNHLNAIVDCLLRRNIVLTILSTSFMESYNYTSAKNVPRHIDIKPL